MKHTDYIGIGSNLGDRMTNCAHAMELISEKQSISIARVSRWYETTAMNGPAPSGQPPFINGALEIGTSLGAKELLCALMDIEARMGRPHPRPKGEPRAIDLDILLYDDLSLNLEHLIIPHPEMTKRLFVLIPLCDIAAGVRHPASGLTIRSLRDLCSHGNQAEAIMEWRDDAARA